MQRAPWVEDEERPFTPADIRHPQPADVITALPLAVLVVDSSGQVVAANDRWARMTGQRAELDGGSWIDAVRNSDRPAVIALIDEARAGRSGSEDVDIRVEGRLRLTRWRAEPFGDGALLTVDDIEHARERQIRLHFAATHDPLTGLLNRAELLRRIDVAVQRAVRHGDVVAVLYVDLDGFKAVNDDRGHQFGDRILVAQARRLSFTTRTVDAVARIGGDEFVVLCEELRDADEAQALARRITNELSAPLEIDGEPVEVSATVGVAFVDGDSDNAQVVLGRADDAMYQAKRGRRPPRAGGGSGPTPGDRALRQAEAEAVRLRSRLRDQTLELAKGEHALKTSLTIIRGWATALDRGWDGMAEADRRNGVAVIRRKADEVSSLCTVMLGSARSDMAFLRLPVEPVDVAALVGDLIGERGPDGDVRVALSTSPCPPVASNPAVLRVIVAELLDNAVKYSPAGSVVTVRCDSAPEGGIVVTVEDQGPGIPEGVDVFAPFVSGPAPQGASSTGIGLYLAGSLARDLGGELTAESGPGRGAVFRLRLPATEPPS